MLQLALAVEVQLAPGLGAVRPVPDVFFAAWAVFDLYPALAGLGACALAGVGWVDAEDLAGAVGLQDLDAVADHVQLGLVAELPAHTQAADDAGAAAVVVANNLQAQLTG